MSAKELKADFEGPESEHNWLSWFGVCCVLLLLVGFLAQVSHIDPFCFRVLTHCSDAVMPSPKRSEALSLINMMIVVLACVMSFLSQA